MEIDADVNEWVWCQPGASFEPFRVSPFLLHEPDSQPPGLPPPGAVLIPVWQDEVIYKAYDMQRYAWVKKKGQKYRGTYGTAARALMLFDWSSGHSKMPPEAWMPSEMNLTRGSRRG